MYDKADPNPSSVIFNTFIRDVNKPPKPRYSELKVCIMMVLVTKGKKRDSKLLIIPDTKPFFTFFDLLIL